MSTLVLIRHGQASLTAADYDVLSPTGIEQSRRLGGYLAAMGRGFDRIYSGPLRRQIDTARHLREAAAAAGLALPEVIVEPDLDEMPALAIPRERAPELAGDPSIAAHLEAIAAAGDDRLAYHRAFEPLFQAMMRRWLAGEFDAQVEPHAAFQARVEAAIERALAAAGKGARVAMITSAGPVGAAVRRAYALAPWDGMRATFVVANASLTELKHRPGELTLTAFNALPHLHDPALVTLR